MARLLCLGFSQVEINPAAIIFKAEGETIDVEAVQAEAASRVAQGHNPPPMGIRGLGIVQQGATWVLPRQAPENGSPSKAPCPA